MEEVRVFEVTSLENEVLHNPTAWFMVKSESTDPEDLAPPILIAKHIPTNRLFFGLAGDMQDRHNIAMAIALHRQGEKDFAYVCNSAGSILFDLAILEKHELISEDDVKVVKDFVARAKPGKQDAIH